MDNEDNRIKHRQIPFDPLHPNRNQAGAAAHYLTHERGILMAKPATPHLLKVSYDLLHTRIEEIERVITELGLHIDARLTYRIKRALWHYTEDTFLANNGYEHSQMECTQKVFACRYEHLDHSLRDHRPEHWRRYL